MGPQVDWCHETSLPADPRSPAQARAFVVRYLGDHRLAHLVDPVRLIASELSTNAVVHARTAFSVTLTERDHVVTLIVEDEEPTRGPDLGTPDLLASGGRGMRIVEQMSDSWGVGIDPRGTKRVWASFAR